MSHDTDDPLAEYRDGTAITINKTFARRFNTSPYQQISQSATADQMAGDPLFYAAYGKGDRNQEHLEIRRVLGAWHAPSYRHLMNVVYNASQGTELVLAYSFLLVRIAGRNMQPIVAALLEGTCAFIQDYHENEFTPPARNAPVITEIEIQLRQESQKKEAKQ